MIRIAKLIKEADPRFQVYWNRANNPDISPELMRRLTPYVDIACMNIFTLAAYNDTSRQESVFQELRKKHRPKAWTYACSGPGRLKAPDRATGRHVPERFQNLARHVNRRHPPSTHQGQSSGVWQFAANPPEALRRRAQS